jgi:hypothetical protein
MLKCISNIVASRTSSRIHLRAARELSYELVRVILKTIRKDLSILTVTYKLIQVIVLPSIPELGRKLLATYD